LITHLGISPSNFPPCISFSSFSFSSIMIIKWQTHNKIFYWSQMQQPRLRDLLLISNATT
jgi:hypothetical protein